MRTQSLGLVVLSFAILGCAAPGVPVDPQPGDFAFVHVQLRG